jgi:hypothetical protein
MYEVTLLYPPVDYRSSVEIEIAGQKFPVSNFGDRKKRFYLAKADPFQLRAASRNAKSIKDLGAVILLPAPEGKEIVQNSNEIVLHARDATTHSVMMRYEPATNKNCLGYWTNPNDTASWEFEVTKPGTFEIELWQGCGKGQGGSTVAVRILHADSVLKEANFTVEDTGHFQNFIPRNLGAVTFREKGQYRFLVAPQNKKAAAVMDIRRIVLKASKAN